MPVSIQNLMFKDALDGRVNMIDNNVEQINQRQVVFVSSKIINDQFQMLPNLKVKARINCGDIALVEYFRRLTKTIYHN